MLTLQRHCPFYSPDVPTAPLFTEPSAKKNDYILQVNNLNFYYDSKHILKNISIDILKNQVTALIGPSGSGKSTLLRVFNRIYNLYPNQYATGQVFFEKENILKTDIDLNLLRTKIGMVFQKPTPFPMSIYENIAFGIRLHEKLNKKDMSERVEWSLREAALWDEVKEKLHDPGTSLSGGQQQRLCIARAVAVKPQVLLMDEPCSALDPTSTQKIEQLMMNLKNNFSIIIVTHNMQQAMRVSNETIFLCDGEVIEHSDTHSFFAKPKHPQSLDYVLGNFA